MNSSGVHVTSSDKMQHEVSQHYLYISAFLEISVHDSVNSFKEASFNSAIEYNNQLQKKLEIIASPGMFLT